MQSRLVFYITVVLVKSRRFCRSMRTRSQPAGLSLRFRLQDCWFQVWLQGSCGCSVTSVPVANTPIDGTSGVGCSSGFRALFCQSFPLNRWQAYSQSSGTRNAPRKPKEPASAQVRDGTSGPSNPLQPLHS